MPEIINKETIAETIKEPSTWQQLKPFVIWAVVILAFFTVITLLTIWIIKKIKLNQDVYHRLYRERRSLCSIHADNYRYLKYWKYRKNQEIKSIYNHNGKLITSFLGYYMGHFYSSEGNLNLCFSNHRKWLILFPIRDIIIINKRDKLIIDVPKEIEEKGIKKIVKESIEQELPTDIENFANDCIYLTCFGIDKDERSGFFFPVLKDKDGNVINMALATYQSLRDVILGNYLYDQTDMFVKVAKKSIDLNPTIRGIQKVSDSSQSIETNQGGN